jgi:catechol 2,3-dioxygenase-like lactoylglutathione lyase family enzyme
MIMDHVGLTVGDYEKSKRFYSSALAPLGIELVAEVGGWAGFGKDGKAEFWFGTGEETQRPIHLAFAAESREHVIAFYVAAIAAGGQDNGPPGIREIYHPDYFGAFVIGPDGHNVEAVCHKAEP